MSGKSLPIAGGFDRFYAAYPRKRGKAEAQKAWTRRVKPEEVEAIIARVELNKLGEWRRKDREYIPHPASWLNGRRWEDEIDPQNQQPLPSTDSGELKRKRKELTPQGQAILDRVGGVLQ